MTEEEESRASKPVDPAPQMPQAFKTESVAHSLGPSESFETDITEKE